jgi:hypothetical protein
MFIIIIIIYYYHYCCGVWYVRTHWVPACGRRMVTALPALHPSATNRGSCCACCAGRHAAAAAERGEEAHCPQAPHPHNAHEEPRALKQPNCLQSELRSNQPSHSRREKGEGVTCLKRRVIFPLRFKCVMCAHPGMLLWLESRSYCWGVGKGK